MPRPVATTVDHYQLLEHIADGAQAEVHRARDLRTGAEVIIKFPHARVLDNPVLTGFWHWFLSYAFWFPCRTQAVWQYRPLPSIRRDWRGPLS